MTPPNAPDRTDSSSPCPVWVQGGEGRFGEAWAEELRRMYRAWFASSGLSLKEASERLRATEVGVHRLVDRPEQDLRQTTFAAVWVDEQPEGWGSIVRSYVREPYRIVKDLASEIETEDVDGVLGGDIERFLAPPNGREANDG